MLAVTMIDAHIVVDSILLDHYDVGFEAEFVLCLVWCALATGQVIGRIWRSLTGVSSQTSRDKVVMVRLLG